MRKMYPKLQKLIPYAEQTDFQEEWKAIKQQKKAQLARWVWQHHHLHIDPHSMFDVQIKRIHEYKRQLLNLLHIITLYNRLRKQPDLGIPARTVMIGGKAAPGYYMAKLIIRLANDIAQVIQQDARIREKLQFLFLENYNVSLAEKLIPATDVSQHISTAGTEASGTGNMKFSLNGALLLGTFDGANLEIAEEVGRENIFLFGQQTEEIQELRKQGYDPQTYSQQQPELLEAMEMIRSGYFNPQEPDLYEDLYLSLMHDDHYLLFADYQSYLDCQQRVEMAYTDSAAWTRMSILNTANMGVFSSDRTIAEYAKEIWNVSTVPLASNQHKKR